MNDLDERRAIAMARAARLSTAAGTLVEASSGLCSRAAQLRIASAERRFRSRHSSDPWVEVANEVEEWFTIRGIVDGRPTTARWRPGRLDCDPELLRRIQVIVAMGEQFSPPDSSGRMIRAAVDAPPVAVLLTVMRAFSRVTSIDLQTELFDSNDPARRAGG